MSRSPKDPAIDRVAEATTQIYNALDTRLNRLDSTFEKFRDEMRADIRAIEASNLNIDRTIQQMHGANLEKQVEDNKTNVGKLEDRLRAVENFQNNLTGRLVVLGVIAMVLASIIGGVAVKYLAHS